MTGQAYGPSEAAVEAGVRSYHGGTIPPGRVRAVLAAAHGPALRARDRSYNGGAVIARIYALADEQRLPVYGEALRWLAWRLEQEWTNAAR